LLRIQSGGQTAELKRQVAEIDSKQLQIKSLLQTAALDVVAQQRAHVSELQRDLDSLRRSNDDSQYKIRTNEQRIAGLDQERAQLRAEYTTANAVPFAHTADDNCPACGQMLPEMRRQEAHDKALAEYNRAKSQRLESIQRRGHAAKDESERLAAEIEQLRGKAAANNEQQLALQERLQVAETELERLRGNVQDPSGDVEYRRLQEERTAICNHMDELEQSTVAAQQQLREDISGLRQESAGYESELAKFDQVQRQQARIAELEEQESKLAAEYEQLQHELYLIEEFTRTKVNMLQTRIDSKFKIARFRLFDEQINGGLKETCETLADGIPYDKGLNNAARINVGLDIINTLSQHYGVSAPIFVDNAEAVTRLLDTDAQITRLIVSAADKRLRIETSDKFREAM
jgi:DNA repair exonuclease SbcCD ATPase subunit